MKRLLFVTFFSGVVVLQGQVLDRMAAVVNNHVITLSDIRREREIRSVLGEKESTDDKAVLKELIDAQIVDDQVSQFPGIEVADTEVQSRIDKISDLRGIPAAAVREAIEKRVRTAQFFDLRFRQFLRPSDEDVLKYYQTVFVPEANKRGMTPVPAMDQVADQIRSNVTEEKMTREIDDWLSAIRKRSRIEVFE